MFKRRLRPSFTIFKRFCECYYNPSPPTEFPWKSSVLSNGVRVIKEQNCSNLECITVMVESGPRYELDCNHGVSHFIEHLADKGFKTMERQKFEQSMRSLGVWMKVRTYREYQEFTFICFPEVAETIVRYIPNFVRDLNPSEADIDCERKVIYQELLDHERDIEAQVFDYVHRAAFQGTPLAKSIISPLKRIRETTIYNISSFLSDQYQPHKLVVASSGPIPVDRFIGTCNICLSCIEPTTETVEHGPSRFTGSSMLYRNDDFGVIYVGIAVEAPGYTSNDFLKFKLLNHIVGQYNASLGNQLRVWPDMVHQAAVGDLCAAFKPFYCYYHDIGLWGTRFESKSVDADDMAMTVMDRWMNLCVMMTSSDFERGKASLKMELARNVDGAVRTSHDMALQMLYKCTWLPFSEMSNLVDHMTRDTVMASCDRHFYDREIALIALGCTEGLMDLSRMRAYTTWVRM